MSADFISFNVDCPKCGKSLMNSYQPIHNKPSIRLKIKKDGQEGTLRLCSLYGCHEHDCDLNLTNTEIYEFYCPSCNELLNTNTECDICHASLVDLKLEVGGKVQICSRKGCENHYIAFKDITTALYALRGKYGH